MFRWVTAASTSPSQAKPKLRQNPAPPARTSFTGRMGAHHATTAPSHSSTERETRALGAGRGVPYGCRGAASGGSSGDGVPTATIQSWCAARVTATWSLRRASSPSG